MPSHVSTHTDMSMHALPSLPDKRLCGQSDGPNFLQLSCVHTVLFLQCKCGATVSRKQASMRGADSLLCRCAVDVANIDEMNILQAALKAMEGAVAALPHTQPDYLLVDGNQLPRGFSRECSQTVVRGDSKSTVIAAASILAKASGSRIA